LKVKRATKKKKKFFLIILNFSGKHEERDDGHGSVQRHFVRKYVLPKDYDMNNVHSSLSTDGVLTIKAPPPAIKNSSERHVQITNTGMPAHLSIKNGGDKIASPAQNQGKSPAVQGK
jgi:hypothetical protein